MEEQLDAAGQPVKLGDLVIYVDSYSSLLIEGIVIKLTPKGMTMESSLNGSKLNRKREQVIKLPNELRIMRMIS